MKGSARRGHTTFPFREQIVDGHSERANLEKCALRLLDRHVFDSPSGALGPRARSANSCALCAGSQPLGQLLAKQERRSAAVSGGGGGGGAGGAAGSSRGGGSGADGPDGA